MVQVPVLQAAAPAAEEAAQVAAQVAALVAALAAKVRAAGKKAIFNSTSQKRRHRY
ncbi:hypothetical protein ACIFOT_07215 [Neobacillus sp. NRS-1170]|uniref:hypothetical protein n=1 Tax=Neobacillus sp. NRS-1170 TaxID=3233898 RepID=UPI003D27F141